MTITAGLSEVMAERLHVIEVEAQQRKVAKALAELDTLFVEHPGAHLLGAI